MKSSDPVVLLVAQLVEEDVGAHNVDVHLHVHTVCGSVTALRRAQHGRGVKIG